MSTYYPPRSLVRLFLLPLLLAASLLTSSAAYAQSYLTASRKAEITTFAGYTYSRPDYGSAYNSGFAAGADYTRYLHFWLVPSFEIRGGYDSGTVLKEYYALGGLQLKHDFGRFHPYGDFLVGATWIHFQNPPTPVYSHDQALTKAMGGGVDVDIMRNFRFKLDYSHQITDYGFNGLSPEHMILTPDRYMLGVTYRIPFKKHISHGYER